MRIEEPDLDAADPADLAEQRAELDAGFDDPEVGEAAFDDEAPLEADPADVAEQHTAVPYDDDR